MKAKFLFSMALLATMFCKSYAQVGYLPVPPSTNVQNFLQSINHPVSHYTGTVNIEVPVHTIELKDISIPVSITYNSSGITVEQEASTVGLGWILNAGGVITKTIIGENDMHDGHTYFRTTSCSGSPHIDCNSLNDITGFYGDITYDFTLCDYLFPNASWSSIVTGGTYEERFNALNNTVYDTSAGGKEFAPDEFRYFFGSKSGRFILARDKSVVKDIEDNVILEPTFSSDMKDITEWKATDTDGTVYVFSATEKVRYCGLHTCNDCWHLSRIETVGGSVITFTYAAGPRQYQTFKRYQQSGADGITDAVQIQRNNYSECKYLSDISYNGGSLQFNYVNDRQDAEWLPRLSHIDRYAGGSKVSTMELSQSYFVSGMSNFELPTVSRLFDLGLSDDGYDTDWNTKRLRLDKVTTIPVDRSDTASYTMSYNTSNLPTKLSTAMDHWGYHNGKYNESLIAKQFHNISDSSSEVELESGGTADRNPDPLYNQAFILTRMTYPTGGYTVFGYETHVYDPSYMTGDPYKYDYYYDREETTVHEEGSQCRNTPGSAVNSAEFSVPTGETAAMPLRMNYNVEVNVSEYNVLFTADMSLTMNLVNKTTEEIVWSKILNVEELPVRGSMTAEESIFEGGQNFSLNSGNYQIQVTGSLRKVLESVTLKAVRTSGPEEFLDDNLECYGGGLRISSISTYAEDSELTLKKEFEYLYTGSTSGRLMSFPRYCTGYRAFSSEGLRNKGYSVGYTRVREYSSGAGGEKYGSVEYDFINKPDSNYCYSWTTMLNGNSIIEKSSDVNPLGVCSRRYPENGTMTAERHYDGERLFYKLLDYTYEIRNDQYQFVWGLAKDYNNISISSPAYWDQEAIDSLKRNVNIYEQSGIPMSYLYPAICPTRVLRTGTRETIHDNGFMYVHREYGYDINRPDFLIRETIEHNDGIKDTLSYTYPFHYSTPVMAALTERNMIARPVETTLIRNGIMAMNTIDEYQVYSSSSVPRLKSKGYRTEESGDIIVNSTVMHYDSKGNPQWITSDGLDIVYLWGYEGQYLVAEIRNATLSDVSDVLGQSVIDTVLSEASPSTSVLASVNSLRTSLPDASVSTFTHHPGIGLTSVTDPDGRITKYSYDGFGRLTRTTEQDSASSPEYIISENTYNYKNF